MAENTLADARRLIAAAWQERMPEQDPETANFFEAGGNSLVAASLMSTLSAEFDRPLPLRMLVRNPTLDALTSAILKELEETDR
jgi:acyl carrier protein